MTQPTTSELRTALAISRERMNRLITDPTSSQYDREMAASVIESLTWQLTQMLAQQPKPYTITTTPTGDFNITFIDSKRGTVTTCPCCDKPLRSLRNAETLAKNLLALDASVDALEPKGE